MWFSTFDSYKNRIIKLFNKYIKITFGHTNVSNIDCKILSLDRYYEYRLLLFIYSIYKYNNLNIKYKYRLPGNTLYNTRYDNLIYIVNPLWTRTYSDQSFFIKSIELFNDLPNKTKHLVLLNESSYLKKY